MSTNYANEWLYSSASMRYAKKGSHMAVKTSNKAIAALTALKALQEDAKRKGLDKLSMEEINAEIAAHRREKRLKLKRSKNS